MTEGVKSATLVFFWVVRYLNLKVRGQSGKGKTSGMAKSEFIPFFFFFFFFTKDYCRFQMPFSQIVEKSRVYINR